MVFLCVRFFDFMVCEVGRPSQSNHLTFEHFEQLGRREWLLPLFEKACEHLKRNQKYKVWQDGYHAEIVESNWFIKQKIEYIHNNPVKDKIVSIPEIIILVLQEIMQDWKYTS